MNGAAPATMPAPVRGSSDRVVLNPTTLAEAQKFAEIIAASDLCPQSMRGKPGDVLVAGLLGMEIGIPFITALQNVAVINGKPCLYGDVALAVCYASGLLVEIEENTGEKALAEGGRCRVLRRGAKVAVLHTFNGDDAARAGLIKKAGPWTQYPARMFQMRARAFSLRDAFPDVLKGIAIYEEQLDVVDTTATVSVDGMKPRAVGTPATAATPETAAAPATEATAAPKAKPASKAPAAKATEPAATAATQTAPAAEPDGEKRARPSSAERVPDPATSEVIGVVRSELDASTAKPFYRLHFTRGDGPELFSATTFSRSLHESAEALAGCLARAEFTAREKNGKTYLNLVALRPADDGGDAPAEG